MKSDTLRVILLGAAAVLCPAVLLAQSDPLSAPASQSQQPNRSPQMPTPTPSMQDSFGHPNDTAQEMKDKMFLRKAGEGGLAQVQLGKLAVEKASSQDVKDFGQKMVDEHTKLNNDMAPIADSMGVTLPKKMTKDVPRIVRYAASYMFLTDQISENTYRRVMEEAGEVDL